MNSFRIASIADVRKVEQAPYAQFMAHCAVYAALRAAAEQHASRTALTAIAVADVQAPVRTWTYAQLLAEIHRTANLFSALVPGRPPRVALLLPPIPQAHFALWAAEAVGIACPINFQLNSEHVVALIQACQADLVVMLGPVPDLDIWKHLPGIQASCPRVQVLAVGAPAGAADVLGFDAARAEQIDNHLLSPGPDDAQAPAALFHTGGTTGAPKLARHTQGNQLHAAWGAVQMFGSTAQDVMLNGFPLFHVAGSFVYGLSTLLSGGHIVLPTRLGLRSAAFMADYGGFVQRHGVTFLAAVPTVIAALLALPLQTEQLHSVRALLTGGSPLPDELAAAFEQRHGIPVRNILGMTESAGVIAIEPLAAPRTPGACGLPLPFTEVMALRSDGSVAAPGEPGILRVRGPNVSPGYSDPARNPGTFEDGWLISGDIGHVDAQGRIFVTGRAKDVIIRGAHNIDPGMIESALLKHPDVLMAAAVGEPDAYAGELPVAFVSLKPGATVDAAALIAFAAPHIPERPAVPKRVDILDSIPVTAVGKVYKPALRARATLRVLEERLASGPLIDRVSVQVEDSASGLRVAFRLKHRSDEPAVRELMKPYPLTYTLT